MKKSATNRQAKGGAEGSKRDNTSKEKKRSVQLLYYGFEFVITIVFFKFRSLKMKHWRQVPRN